MNISDTAKSITQGMTALISSGQPGYRAHDAKLAWANANLAADSELRVTSRQFENGSSIPASYSADSGTVSPPISWNGIPGQAKSIVLVVEDPDAPTPNPFVHWLVFDMEPDRRSLPEGASSSENILEGKNSHLKRGWTGHGPAQGRYAASLSLSAFCARPTTRASTTTSAGPNFSTRWPGMSSPEELLVGTYARS